MVYKKFVVPSNHIAYLGGHLWSKTELTTWAGIAKRFTPEHLAGLPAAMRLINTRWVNRLPTLRRQTLLREVTIDGDATDVEVYGRTKQGAAHAYTGALTLRPHIGHWAEAGVPLAAELMGGTEDPRSNMVDLLDAAIAALPEGVDHIRCRWDATSPPTSRRRVSPGVCRSRSAPNASLR